MNKTSFGQQFQGHIRKKAKRILKQQQHRLGQDFEDFHITKETLDID